MSTRDAVQRDADGSPPISGAAIKRLAAEMGFDRCGITNADPFSRSWFLRDWLARGYAGSMSYLHRHADSRMDIRKWLPWARSVIVTALNYMQPRPPRPADVPRGRIAMYAWGADYHLVMRDRLELLVRKMRDSYSAPFQSRICVDTSAIVEREFAARAGIGWIGKNTLVLNQDIGSMFFLGLIITDLDLPPDAPSSDHCGSCTRCLEACPTSAFPEPYVMDARRCISYLTIEHRGEIDPALAAHVGDWVFGCDVCQNVCPYNHGAPDTSETAFAPLTADSVYPPLESFKDWDAHDYNEFVAGKATDRATPEMWKRNAAIAQQSTHG